MTGARRRPAVATIGLLILTLAGCTSGSEAGSSQPSGTPTPSITPTSNVTPAREVTPVAFAQFSGALGQPRKIDFEVTALRVGKSVGAQGTGAIVTGAVAFPPMPAPGRCLDKVLLLLGRQTRIEDFQVGVYPGAGLSLARRKAPPQGSGNPDVLLDNQPKGVITEDGRAVDISDLARAWADGGPFPSRDRTIPEGSPLVLILRPPDNTDGDYTVTIPTAEVRLSIRRSSAC